MEAEVVVLDYKKPTIVVVLILVIITSTIVVTLLAGNSNDIPDNERPIIVVENPTPGDILSGTVQVTFNVEDEEELDANVYVDGNFIATADGVYSWDTSLIPDGKHTLKLITEDSHGESAGRFFQVVVDNHDEVLKTFNGTLKVMVYNILESGLNDDWKTIVSSENPDILVLVETGAMDDNANESFNDAVSDLNAHFENEPLYDGICAKGIQYSTSGEAIITKYPIMNFTQIPIVQLDDGTDYDVTHDFIDAVVDVNGTQIHVIGGHLKASEGETNENRRHMETEGIINYMDNLGNVPILYMSDQNSFSPVDTGLLAPEGMESGYGPMTMMLFPLNISYGNHSSTQHNFTDVYRHLNPTLPGHTYGHQSNTASVRIDFIIINSFFYDKMASANVISYSPASTASDHFAVTAIFNWS